MKFPGISVRPLTPIMINILKECVNREANGLPPIGAYYTQSAKGLFQRGFLWTREYELNGKKRTGFVSTRIGRDYLQLLDQLKAISAK